MLRHEFHHLLAVLRYQIQHTGKIKFLATRLRHFGIDGKGNKNCNVHDGTPFR